MSIEVSVVREVSDADVGVGAAANRLYQQPGFERRDTHAYRLADGGAG